MRGGIEMERDVTISRRRFLQAMAAARGVVACAPAGPPGTSAAAGQLSEPPLTDAERRDFNPSALQATTYKGKVVAYPLWIVPWFEYINLDLFKEAGVTPPKDGNWTYDELFAAAKKLTFKRANGRQ